jgi:chromosome segregation ATPase
MRHSRAWAVAAVAAALVMGAGCVTRSTYNHDLAIERSRTEAERLKTAIVQEKLDRANQDVKKAWDAIAQKAADYTTNQKAADDARRQLAGLRQQIDQLKNADKTSKAAADKASSEQAEKLKKLQDQCDAAQKENAELREIAEKQKAQIEELKARLEEKGSAPRPPIHTAPMMPATNAPAPAGT